MRMMRPAPAKAHLEPSQPEAVEAKEPKWSLVVRTWTCVVGLLIGDACRSMG